MDCITTKSVVQTLKDREIKPPQLTNPMFIFSFGAPPAIQFATQPMGGKNQVVRANRLKVMNLSCASTHMRDRDDGNNTRTMN